MNEIARSFELGRDLKAILSSVTYAAVQLIDGVDFADVLLITDGEFRSVTPTDPIMTELDAVQQKVGQGPCLEAVINDSVIRSHNLASDERWPLFASHAVQRGVHSVLSYQLYTHAQGAGALNLFGRAPTTFDLNAETVGAMLATQAAIAIIADQRSHQFESALASRDLIGQAKGIIMERYNLDAVAAFDMIRQLSQDQNVKAAHIAQKIIDMR